MARDIYDSEEIEDFVAELPHGSGIDADWSVSVDYEATIKDGRYRLTRFVFANDLHVMNDMGMYIGWVEFEFAIDISRNKHTVFFRPCRVAWADGLTDEDVLLDGYSTNDDVLYDDTQPESFGFTMYDAKMWLEDIDTQIMDAWKTFATQTLVLKEEWGDGN